MRFRTTIELSGKTATGIEVPAAVVAKLGSRWVGGSCSRSAPRSAPAAKRFFEGLSFSNKQRIAIESAKTPETRERRIAKSVSSLREG